MSEKIKFIAFYLPQYHVIPENEFIYGKGFTEWDNVKKANPLFAGHYQPHIPHKMIGYYDLTDESFIEKQHDLAYRFGVSGFCYYYYNLDGRLLLDKPLKIINKNKYIKNNFCLSWCHASWYNNRDPSHPIFIPQSYQFSNIKFLVQDLEQYFKNDRYIKINKKPLLIICSPEKIVNAKDYIYRLREEIALTDFKEIIIAGQELYGGIDPEPLGLDFMIEYAPNWVDSALIRVENKVKIYHYNKAINFLIKKSCPEYLRVRCSFPGWDNTPRKGEHGLVFIENSPRIFKMHLNYLKKYTKVVLPDYLQYIFINVWNEWGEGCYLEPDKRNMLAYLEVVKEVSA